MAGLGRQCYAAFTVSISIIACGMAYGWVSPVLNKLTDENGDIKATKEQISWIAAAIELGCLGTPFLASYLMEKYGRKWPVMITVPLFVISWILTITTRSVEVLYVKRILDGMGMGFVTTIAPIYLAEIAEAEIRGFILLSISITWYTGTLLQVCLGLYLPYNVGAWVNLAIPIVFFCLFSFLPESPYYLMMKRRKHDALKSLAWYRNSHPSSVTKELNCIEEYLTHDSENEASWSMMFSNRVYRKCLIIMAVVISATILTGLTTIPSYASEMFAEIDGWLSPNVCTIAIAFLFLIVSGIVSLIIDKVGRRPLLITSAIGCCVSNLSSAIFSYFKHKINYSWTPFLTVGLYCFFVSLGLAPVMVSFQGELFPAGVRSMASGLIMVFTTFVSLVSIKLYYIIGSSIGLHVNYLLYATVAGFSTVWLYFNAPETKNKTFNELYNEFEKLYGGKSLKANEELSTLNVVH